VRFEEDNWESPTLGRWGIGWQVLLDGQEITQFTYFQQAGGIDLRPISAEITYGLERIAMYLQDVDDVYELDWAAACRTATCARRRSTSSRATRSSWRTWSCTGGSSTARWPRAGGCSARAGRAAAAGLRLVPQELARLQRARRARARSRSASARA
jgi:hypothetical protein